MKHELKQNLRKPLPINISRMINHTLYPVKRYLIDETKHHFGIDIHIQGYDEIRKAYLWLISKDKDMMWNRLTFENADMLRCDRKTFMTKQLSLLEIMNFDIHPGYFYIKISNDTYVFINKENKQQNDHSPMHPILHMYFFGKRAYAEFYKFLELINTTNFPNGYLDYDCRSFNFSRGIIPRSKDTVYMENKQKFIDDVKKLKAVADSLIDKGITFAPGILLYGEPGCGKSTIITMLASELNADIVTLSYVGLDKFINDLAYFKENNPHKNILVAMEDIDLLYQNREKCNNAVQKASLNTLFQFLDGSLTIPGVIMVATTNYIDRLDPALIRDGRFDIKLEVKGLNEALSKDMCDNFNMSYDILENEEFPINPAYLQGKILKRIKTEILKK